MKSHIQIDKNIHIKLQPDNDVRNRLYMTKKGRIVEATGFVHTDKDEHYLECKDQRTGAKTLYAKRHLRERGYAHRPKPFDALRGIQVVHGD